MGDEEKVLRIRTGIAMRPDGRWVIVQERTAEGVVSKYTSTDSWPTEAEAEAQAQAVIAIVHRVAEVMGDGLEPDGFTFTGESSS